MSASPQDVSAEPIVKLGSSSLLTFPDDEGSALADALRRVERQRSATVEEIRGHTDTPHQDYGHSNSWI